jgi:hypothetical protein
VTQRASALDWLECRLLFEELKPFLLPLGVVLVLAPEQGPLPLLLNNLGVNLQVIGVRL